MIIIPAIDIKDGRAVRLVQGDADRATVYAEDPVEVARRFVAQGARRLHVVDLDGAFAGRSVHRDLIGRIASLGVPVQAGGGVRDVQSLVRLIELGARWIILGTAAIADRPFLEEALNRFGDNVIIGIDARDGHVRVEGWVKAALISPDELAREVRDLGCQRVIYTNVASDGMLTGPDVDGLKRLTRLGDLRLTASGGIGSVEHIKMLRPLEKEGVDSCIIGKAFYEGKLDLTTAQEAAE